MNLGLPRSEELRALAERFVQTLPNDIDEALLTGSVSRGDADELSDVEMLLVAGHVPLRLSALGIELWREDFFENETIAWYTARVEGRLAEYPETLVARIVNDASEEWLEYPLGVRAHLRPGGWLPLAATLADDLRNVLRIVFALNRAWEPSWKRLPQLLAPLAIKPERLAERIDEALEESSLQKTRELVLDTLVLAPDLPRVVLARERTAQLLRELA